MIESIWENIFLYHDELCRDKYFARHDIVSKSSPEIGYVYSSLAWTPKILKRESIEIIFIRNECNLESNIVKVTNQAAKYVIPFYLIDHRTFSGVPIPYQGHIIAKIDRLSIKLFFSDLVEKDNAMTTIMLSHVLEKADEIYKMNGMADKYV